MSSTIPLRLYVACGSYDGSVFAMSYDHLTLSETGQIRLKAEFIDPDAHPSPVTALAVCGDVVVSGSTDEAIQIFSLSKHCRMGCLEVHTGSIRHLVFADSRHFLSAGEDACLAIWRRPNSRNATTATWQCIRQMRRHKGPITSLCLHPSSRIAFTLSEDKTLRVWNLMRGRQAYTTRLKSLNAEGASAIDITGHFLLISWPYDRLDVVDLNQNKDKPVLSAKFSTSFSVPPVVFHEDEEHLYLLIGFGNKIKAFRCPIAATMANASKLEPLGESRLPGKRLKFLKVLPWPAQLVSSQPDLYGGRRRLVTLVTTDIDGSYVRGYAVDLETSTDISSPDALRPVFAYDIRDIRLTRIDTVWASTGLDKDELQSADVDMEEEEDDGTSEEEVDKDDESV